MVNYIKATCLLVRGNIGPNVNSFITIWQRLVCKYCTVRNAFFLHRILNAFFYSMLMTINLTSMQCKIAKNII